MQSAFQEKFSYTMAVRGVSKVCRMRALAVTKEMGRGEFLTGDPCRVESRPKPLAPFLP